MQGAFGKGIGYNADDPAAVCQAALLGRAVSAPGIAGDESKALKGRLAAKLCGKAVVFRQELTAAY